MKVGAVVYVSLLRVLSSVRTVVSQASVEPTMDIMALLAADDKFSTLVTAVKAAGLTDALIGGPPKTLFAPNNAAFEQVNVTALLEDPDALSQILLNHVVGGVFTSEIVGNTGRVFPSVMGENITLAFPNPLLPPMVNNAQMLAYDLMATNGVVHEIDAVLDFTQDYTTTVNNTFVLPNNVVEVASAVTALTSFVAALQSTELDQVLTASPGPFTIFAPSNKAFVAVAPFLVDFSQDDIRGYLMSHVVQGNITTAEVARATDPFVTMVGSTITAAVNQDGQLTVNDVTFTDAATLSDLVGSNGIIHVVDAMLPIEGLDDTDGGDGSSVDGGGGDTSDAGGCYDMAGGHVCGCEADACSRDLCEAKGRIWTDQCPFCDQTECGGGDSGGMPNLIEVATKAGMFMTLLESVELIGYTDVLATMDPLTVFAPTDEAFAAYDGLEALKSNPQALAGLLANHVVQERIMSADTKYGQTFLTLGQKIITVNINADSTNSPTVNNANVLKTDVEASNGVIHILDAVLTFDTGAELPNIVELAESSGQNPELVAAITESGLADTLRGPGPFTVFIPTETAFDNYGGMEGLMEDEEALRALLLNHVVNGRFLADDLQEDMTFRTVGGAILTMGTAPDGIAMVNNARIELGDVEASNGVIHIIDAVLEFPPTDNIVELAMSASDNFSTLVTAVKAAGLVDALSGAGPMTVLAPNNAAFAKVQNLDALLADTDALKDLLLNHVFDGLIYGENVEFDKTYAMLGGKSIVLVNADPVFMVNNAVLVATDMFATNGVVHEIDSVLTFPEDDKVVDVVVPAEEDKNETSVIDEEKNTTEKVNDTEKVDDTDKDEDKEGDSSAAAFTKTFSSVFIGIVALLFAL